MAQAATTTNPLKEACWVLYHLQTATTDSFPDISEYLADRNGNNVLMESAGNKRFCKTFRDRMACGHGKEGYDPVSIQ